MFYKTAFDVQARFLVISKIQTKTGHSMHMQVLQDREIVINIQSRDETMTAEEVLLGDREWYVKTADCTKELAQFDDNSIDLVFGSPPYAEKGERYLGRPTKWTTDDWIDWMLKLTMEAVRVSNGYVIWVANGAVRNGRYLPACEGLIWKAHEQGLICERPCIWHKNAPPNRRDWFGNDWEYVVAFKSAAKNLYFDWEAVAEPPKYKSGGRFRQRAANGNRRLGSEYPTNKLARPRDVVRVTVGGGHLGSELAHENEAPFPEGLAEYFVRACSPKNGVVLDPFSGSGTTGAVAIKHGRRYVGFDARKSQAVLSRKRIRLAQQGHER